MKKKSSRKRKIRSEVSQAKIVREINTRIKTRKMRAEVFSSVFNFIFNRYLNVYRPGCLLSIICLI